jgi:hypothetical protein
LAPAIANVMTTARFAFAQISFELSRFVPQ